MLVLFTAPPEELELQYEGVTRRVPPPAGSISLIPAGSPDLDPARVSVHPLEDHLDDGLTLHRMAEAAHLSVYHFARGFKAATGLAPHQYVSGRRIERAKQLLDSEPDLSLAEIAGRIGFSDQSQFSRHFKRVVGVTPGRFRRSARNT